MKKTYLSIFLAAFMLVTLTISCEKDFEEINKHPNKPEQTVPDYLFTGLVKKVGYKGNIHLYANQPQTMLFTRQATNLPSESVDKLSTISGINDNYTLYFKKLADINKLRVELANSSFDQEQHRNQYAMLDIFEAFHAFQVTDAFGDMPYFEAGKGLSDLLFRPVYDSQGAIYIALLDKVKNAVDQLQLADNTPADEPYLDFEANSILTGSSSKMDNFTFYKKFGNALLLKHGLRISKFDETAAKAYIQAGLAGPLMESEEDSAMLLPARLGPQSDNGTRKNAWAWARYYGPTSQPSQFMATKMVDAADHADIDPMVDNVYDPRFYGIYFPNQDGEFKILPNSPDDVSGLSPELAQANIYLSGENSKELKEAPDNGDYEATHAIWNRFYANSIFMPNYFLSFAEQNLIIAEIYASGLASGDAKMHYEAGIRTSVIEFFNLQNAQYPDKNPTKIIIVTDADVDAMLLNPAIAYDVANGLEQIRTQRWIDYLNRPNEAWAMMRRTNHFDVDANLPIKNNGKDITMGFRYIYPGNEADYNTENYLSQLTKMGGYDNIKYKADIYK